MLAVEFPSPCDGANLESGAPSSKGLVQVRTASPLEGMQSLPPNALQGPGASIGFV